MPPAQIAEVHLSFIDITSTANIIAKQNEIVKNYEGANCPPIFLAVLSGV